MALDANALALDLTSRLVAAAPIATAADLAQVIADAVVEHITNNAVVMPTALVAPTGGGPVTGTGTVT